MTDEIITINYRKPLYVFGGSTIEIGEVKQTTGADGIKFPYGVNVAKTIIKRYKIQENK